MQPDNIARIAASVGVVIPWRPPRSEAIFTQQIAGLRQSIRSQYLPPTTIHIAWDSSGSPPDFVNLLGLGDELLRLHYGLFGGSAAARNVCLDALTDEFVAFLDSDDRWDADHLESSVALLRSTGADVLVAMTRFRSSSLKLTRVASLSDLEQGALPQRILRQNPISTSGVVMTAAAVGRRRFQEDLARTQDRMFWYEAAIDGLTFVGSPTPTVTYNWDPERLMLGSEISSRARTLVKLRKTHRMSWLEIVRAAASDVIVLLKKSIRAAQARSAQVARNGGPWH